MEPAIVVAIVMAAVAILSNVIAVTVFVVRLGGTIALNHSTVIGKIDVLATRLHNVETGVTDHKTMDRRMALVEDRQAQLAVRQGNMEKDNLLIRDDLGKLHQGLDRHNHVLQKYNEKQLG